MLRSKHLKDVNEDYLTHLSFAWGYAWRGFLIMWAGFLHGLFPDFLVNSVRNQAKWIIEDIDFWRVDE